MPAVIAQMRASVSARRTSSSTKVCVYVFGFRGRVAAALDGLDVDENRCRDLERGLEGALELVEVVTVEDADVCDPHVLEEADFGP